MKLTKSSRHSKITGDFGESIVLYLLSRHGFECARVDHTGIDLIARRPNSPEVLGIPVKSRSRQTALKAHTSLCPMTGLLKLRLRAMRLAALPILRSLLMLAKKFECSCFHSAICRSCFLVGARSRRGKCPKRFCESITLTIKSKSLNSQPTIKSGFEVSSPPTKGSRFTRAARFVAGTVKPEGRLPPDHGWQFR
jgi:hypothetical protein